MSGKQQAMVVPGYQLSFELREIDKPVLTLPHDILVRVKAAAINPVDYKVKNGFTGNEKKGDAFEVPDKVIGYDGAGIVEAVGSEVTQFKVGDEVYYAGSIIRQGSFQQYQLVDARIVGRKPKSLSFEQAAALPLTSITAYEGMKEMLQVKSGESMLVTAGAGGVGSITIQLAKLWGMSPVIATASRDDTIKWAQSMGADEIVDHRAGIDKEFSKKGLKPVQTVFNAFGDQNLTELAEVIDINGRIVGINGDLNDKQVSAFPKFFFKRVKLTNEYMFARPQFGFDQQYQGDLLNEISALVDEGKLKTTMYQSMSWKQINDAFKILEDRKTIGKISLIID